jgi:hypothetical protein
MNERPHKGEGLVYHDQTEYVLEKEAKCHWRKNGGYEQFQSGGNAETASCLSSMPSFVTESLLAMGIMVAWN